MEANALILCRNVTALPGGPRIHGKWAANIDNGSTPGGKAVTPGDFLILQQHPCIVKAGKTLKVVGLGREIEFTCSTRE